MIRIDLIGPGDIDFHFRKLLGMSEKKLEEEIDKIAALLNPGEVELSLLPDDGICLEVAKRFKARGGRVIGLVPQDDKVFGIAHLRQYIDAKVENKPLFDELINTGDWFRQDLTKCLFGDVVLCLGLSPGTDGERAYGVYLYKIATGFKQGVKTPVTKIHPQARAGIKIPYTIILYTPFMIQKTVSPEEEAYTKKFGINLDYAHSASDLEKKLSILSRL